METYVEQSHVPDLTISLQLDGVERARLSLRDGRLWSDDELGKYLATLLEATRALADQRLMALLGLAQAVRKWRGLQDHWLTVERRGLSQPNRAELMRYLVGVEEELRLALTVVDRTEAMLR